jgi:hypothetical protein
MNYKIVVSSKDYLGAQAIFTGYYQEKNWYGKLVWKQVVNSKYHNGSMKDTYTFSCKNDVIRALLRCLPYKTETIETGVL